MEAHTHIGAAMPCTCCVNMQIGFVPTTATSVPKKSLFTHSQASDIHTFRHNRLAAKLHKLAQVKYKHSDELLFPNCHGTTLQCCAGSN